MAGITGLEKLQLGGESTSGTAVAATAIWRGENSELVDDREVAFVEEQIGVMTSTTNAYVPKEAASVTMGSTSVTCQQLPYILEGAIEAATPVQDGTGAQPYVRIYNVPTTADNTRKTFTIEWGDNEHVQETDYAYVESFKITGNGGEGLMMEANWRGRTVVDSSFTSVTLAAIEPSDNLVFGGSNFYRDGTGTFPATTEVTSTLLSFELDVTTGLTSKFTNLGKDFDFTYFNKDAFSATLSLVYEHNAGTDTERDTFEAATPRSVQLKFEGGVFGTVGAVYSNFTLLIDAVGVYTEFPPSDLDGNSTVEAVLQIGYDPTATSTLDITVVNRYSDLFTNPPTIAS